MSSTTCILLYEYSAVISDTANDRIQLFLPNRTNGITLAGTAGIIGGTSNLLDHSQGMLFDVQLNLYTTDSRNYRMQTFSRYFLFIYSILQFTF